MRNMIYFKMPRLKMLVINVKTLNMRIARGINQKVYYTLKQHNDLMYRRLFVKKYIIS